jgi:ABC-type antimicrobial peptide transport system permease subunit
MQMQTFGEKSLQGKTVRASGLGDAKLSGVMQNYNYSTLQYPIAGLMFCLNHKEFMEPYRNAYIRIKPENREMALAHVQQVLDAQQTVKVTEGRQILALSDIMDDLNRPERTLSMIFGILSLACILVVSFGIYSLISLTIEQRRREIAIRKVHGAEFADMLRLFFREYLILVAIGNTIALTLGYYIMQRWFETYAYRTTLGWWLFAVVLVTTGVIVFLSVVGKISEAARVNPAEAMKYE